MALMKPEGVYLYGWLGYSGVGFEVVLDREKVDFVHVWTKEQLVGGGCAEALLDASHRFQPTIPPDGTRGEDEIIDLKEYFLGDVVYSLMAKANVINANRYDTILGETMSLRSLIHQLKTDGVLLRLEMRHDLKRHCDDGGACFWDNYRHRWVCIQ